jgi:hypothetical protein
MELLVETDLLEILAPELARGLRPAAPSGDGSGDDEARRQARLWAYLGALDRSTERRPTPPSNALILAVLMMPPLRDALDPASSAVRDVGQLVSQSIAPALERLKPSRRDSELARQILLAVRYLLRKQHRRVQGRDFYDEAVRLTEILEDAEGLDPTLAASPIVAEGVEGEAEAGAGDGGDEGMDDGLPPELASSEFGDRGRRRRRGRRGGRRDEVREAGGHPGGGGGPRPERERERDRDRSAPPSFSAAQPALDLEGLLSATRSLASSTARPGFLGSGSFGGPWSSRSE